MIRHRITVALVSVILPAAACTDPEVREGPAPPETLDTTALEDTEPIDISSVEGTIAFPAGPLYEEDVYVVNADGTGLRQITDDQATDFDPTWSPDGMRIA